MRIFVAGATGGAGIYNVVWLPAWVAQFIVGARGVAMMTVRGAANAKARRELGWTPSWPSWRDGFRKGLA
jgi:hypothetical protein